MKDAGKILGKVGGQTKMAAAWVWRRASVVVSLGLLVAVFFLGLSIGSPNGKEAGHRHDEQKGGPAAEGEKKPKMWTCAMHPQIRQPEPGKCPICGMDLVPVEEEKGDAGARTLVMSEESLKLAEIETAPVERRAIKVEVRMVGKVEYDETRVRTIAAWVPGRVEKLYADYTGKVVAAGEPLVDLYSPELYVAQKELILAHKAAGQGDGGGALAMGVTTAMLEAAREKLKLWGLSAKQIEELELQDVPSITLTIPAPIGGTVFRKEVWQGVYVDIGTQLMQVADLSTVWVMLQAFESDMGWLAVGQDVHITTEAYPGVVLHGTIRFINPFVDAMKRTARVRVEVPNPDGLLRPDMFARGSVFSGVDESGEALLVPEAAHRQPLVVPESAVLRTGKRAVVYVKVPGAERPTYEGKTIVLGPKAADYFVVRSGLSEGEEVVSNGAFKIDSSLQIQAKESMMSLPSEDKTPVADIFLSSLGPVYQAYFMIWEALAADDAAGARKSLADLATAAGKVDAAPLSADRAAEWKQTQKLLHHHDVSTADLPALRKAFETASQGVLALERRFGHPGKKVHYQMYCPMAFDNRGAFWLQDAQELSNPYFGPMMQRCGEAKETFAPGGPQSEQAPATPAAPPQHQH